MAYERMSRLIILPLTGLLITAVASAQDLPAGPDTATGVVLERILVKVNGEIVTQSELESRQVSMIRSRSLQPTTNAELSRIIRELTPEIIAGVVDELLLVQHGKALGYRLGEEQFQDLVEGIKTENDIESDEALLAVLEEQEGMTLDDLRRVMEQQMLVSQVQQIEILNKVSITDVEARAYYDSNLEEFTEPAMVTLREILIAAPAEETSVNNFADQQARAEAQSVRERLLAGDDFSAVAVSVSDAPSRANGGLIGPIQRSEISEMIQEVIEPLAVGDLSEPIQTPQGYQILKLEMRTEPAPRSFTEVRDDISNNVFNDRRLAEYNRYLGILRNDAIIEWKNEDLREAYESYRARETDPVPPS